MSYKYLDLTGLSHFWDKIKAKFDSFSRNDLAVLQTKEYSGIYGSADDQEGASFYFASVRPDNWYKMWRVKYKVYATVPNQNNYHTYSLVEIYGNTTEVSYKIFNRILSTSYRPIMYHNVYRLTSTGYNNNYNHTLGIGLRGGANPTSSSYPRTIKIELLETENCTVTMFDSMIKRGAISGQGTTNFTGISELDGCNNGLRETGDDNDTSQLRHNNGNYIGSTALYRYMLLLQKNETTLIPVNAVSNSTATTKTLTTEEFDPFGQLLYYNTTTTINQGSAIPASNLIQQTRFDLRYSFNTGTTLTTNKDVYIVAVPQANGKAKLHTTPITQTLPSSEDGLIYIYLGHAYSNYQIEMHAEHPIYEYKGGILKLYTNDIFSNYSREIQSGTIDDLINRLYGKSGLTGSISLTAKSSGTGSEIPAGWYNFYFAPHRNGMTWNNSDNGNYGTIILTPMNFSGKSWIIRRGYSNGSPVVSEVKPIATGDLGDYVTLGTTQTITGAKTLNSTLTMSNINNATYTTSTTGNIIPSATGLANPPWNKDLWHDHFALLRYHTIESKEVTNDGTTWNASSLDINSMFLGKDSASVTILAASNLAFRFVLKNTTFAYSGVSWFELGVAYTNPFSNFEVLIEFSSDKSTWTTCHKSTIASNSAPFFLKNNTGFTSDGYIRVTFTKKTELTTGTVRIGCLKALCIRKGDQGLGAEYEYPYDWDINSNLLPIANNTKNLGSNNQKWANVYATTFQGNATSATKATGDKNGNDITTTYQPKLTSQTAYTSKGSATKVPQITTNSLGQVTGITEVDIEGGGSSIPKYKIYCEDVQAASQQGYPDLLLIDIDYQVTPEMFDLSTPGLYYCDFEIESSAISDLTSDSCKIQFVQYEWNEQTQQSDMTVLASLYTVMRVDGQNEYIPHDFWEVHRTYHCTVEIAAHARDSWVLFTGAEAFVDKVVTQNSTNAVSSGAVYTALQNSGGITIDDVYPVGSIYMSVNNTNPSTLFGGTWEQLKDRFLLGAGDTYTAGATGGSATKTIAKANLPNYTLYSASHSHQIKSYGGYSGSTNNPSSAAGTNQGTKTGATEGTTITVKSGGSGTALDIMPPYLAVYMWKRTA